METRGTRNTEPEVVEVWNSAVVKCIKEVEDQEFRNFLMRQLL